MNKVLFLAYYFPPIGGAGVQRSLKFAQYLPEQGYLPTIVTAGAPTDDRWTPQDLTLLKAIPENVQVCRVKGKPPVSSSKLRSRAERWLRMPTLFSEWWIAEATRVGTEIGEEHDLIFATMSPFESGEVARRLSLHFGIPWVADLRDPWALDEMQVYPSRLHRKLEMRKMERMLSSASLIVMNTPEAANALREAFPRLRQPVISITNGFDQTDFDTHVSARDDGKFRLVHTGYFHTESGLQLRKRNFYRLLGGVEPGIDILTRSHTVLLTAIERWCANRPEIKKNFEIVFAGKSSPEDQAVVSNSPVGSLVRFAGYLPHEKSVELMRTADLLFLPMPKLPPGRRSRIVPGKTYEYLAARQPILAAVPDGDAKDFVSKSGMGWVCPPDDVQEMVRLLDQVYLEWKSGHNTRSTDEAFLSQFERRSLTLRLAAAFDSLLPSCPTHEAVCKTVAN